MERPWLSLGSSRTSRRRGRPGAIEDGLGSSLRLEASAIVARRSCIRSGRLSRDQLQGYAQRTPNCAPMVAALLSRVCSLRGPGKAEPLGKRVSGRPTKSGSMNPSRVCVHYTVISRRTCMENRPVPRRPLLAMCGSPWANAQRLSWRRSRPCLLVDHHRRTSRAASCVTERPSGRGRIR